MHEGVYSEWMRHLRGFLAQARMREARRRIERLAEGSAGTAAPQV